MKIGLRTCNKKLYGHHFLWHRMAWPDNSVMSASWSDTIFRSDSGLSNGVWTGWSCVLGRQNSMNVSVSWTGNI